MAHRFFEDRDEYKFQDFTSFINEAGRRARKTLSAKNMYLGDMWDKGRGYIGPIPVDGDENAAEIFRSLQRTFTSRNVIEEVVDRQVDALLSRSPDWKIFDKKTIQKNPKAAKTFRAPRSNDPASRAASKIIDEDNTAENNKINEAEMILSEIWTNANVGDALKASMTERLVTGRGMLRIYLSKRYFDKQDEDMDFVNAAKYVKIQFVENADGSLIDDDGEKLSVIKVNKSNKDTLIEFCFVDDDDMTYVGTIDKAGSFSTTIELADGEEISDLVRKLSESAELSSPWDLQQYITADEILGKPLVSESMLQNNRSLNLDLSLAVQVLIEAGYSEMVVTNVALETESVADPENPGRTVQRPSGLKRGAGIINNLVGEQTIDAEGRTYFEKPSAIFKEPTPVTTFVDGEDLFYRQILCEAKQIHVILNEKSDPSGESRVQSRQDFVKKSQRYKPSLDIHGSWALNCFLHIVAVIAGKPGYFSEIGVIMDSKIYAGELTAAEKDVVISQFEHGIMAPETAMVLLGIEDPILEMDMIEQWEAKKLELQVRRLEATAAFGNMNENGRPATSEKTKQEQEEQGNTKIRRTRNQKG